MHTNARTHIPLDCIKWSSRKVCLWNCTVPDCFAPHTYHSCICSDHCKPQDQLYNQVWGSIHVCTRVNKKKSELWGQNNRLGTHIAKCAYTHLRDGQVPVRLTFPCGTCVSVWGVCAVRVCTRVSCCVWMCIWACICVSSAYVQQCAYKYIFIWSHIHINIYTKIRMACIRTWWTSYRDISTIIRTPSAVCMTCVYKKGEVSVGDYELCVYGCLYEYVRMSVSLSVPVKICRYV